MALPICQLFGSRRSKIQEKRETSEIQTRDTFRVRSETFSTNRRPLVSKSTSEADKRKEKGMTVNRTPQCPWKQINQRKPQFPSNFICFLLKMAESHPLRAPPLGVPKPSAVTVSGMEKVVSRQYTVLLRFAYCVPCSSPGQPHCDRNWSNQGTDSNSHVLP